MARLLYQGHASIRITAANGTVIYIDPYAGEGYDAPADIILVTHRHGDHNRTELPPKKPDCALITETEALEGGRKNCFSVNGTEIETVEAYNKNHKPDESAGYIISLDGVCVYIAGDTSKTTGMEALAARRLDYAFLPCDGVYNMDTEEASVCARLINAKHAIPYHMKLGALFDRETADKFKYERSLILEPGEEIEL